MKKNKNQKKENPTGNGPILEDARPQDKIKSPQNGGSSDAKPYPAPGDTV